MKTSSYKKHILLLTLFLIAFLERTVFDLGANIEIVTASIILASLYTGRRGAFWLALLIMTTTDRVLGNTSILLFTWSGFLIPALFIASIMKKVGTKRVRKVFVSIGAGLGTNVFFFLWTNFGVWALDTWGMYPNTLLGLLASYVNGLPFLKNQFISSLVFIPLGIVSIEVSRLLYKRLSVSTVFKSSQVG